MKNELAVDSDNLKALKSFGFSWLILKDLDRKNFKPFLNHLPLSFLFIVRTYWYQWLQAGTTIRKKCRLFDFNFH